MLSWNSCVKRVVALTYDKGHCWPRMLLSKVLFISLWSGITAVQTWSNELVDCSFFSPEDSVIFTLTVYMTA